MSGSTVMPPIIEGLWLRIGPLIRIAARDFDATKGRGVELHVVAIEALRRHDAAGTRAAIEADISRFFSLLSERSAPAEPA
jgi:DNA-binding GntR family transcriptional regulator